MSDKSIHKVCKLLNALFYGLEQLGYSYDENLNITIRGQYFKPVIYEMKSKKPHKMTKEEQKSLKVVRLLENIRIILENTTTCLMDRYIYM